MNDHRRLELERFFDGESPGPEAAAVEGGLAADPAAARYLAELDALRRLANRHDPAAGHPGLGGLPTIPFNTPSRNWWRPAVAAAAVLAAAIGWGLSRDSVEVPTRTTQMPKLVEASPAPRSVPEGGESPEVAWHRWANAKPRRPEVAGRALWQSAGRRRPAALEVLTLELANAPPGSAGRLQRAAAVRVAAPGGRARPEPRHHAAPDAEPRL